MNSIFIKHDVRIGCIVIHVGIELPAVAVFKGVADEFVLAYPFTKLHYGRLVRGEVNEPMSGENGQHIKVIRQLSVHLVCFAVCAQIWRVNEEHHIGYILVLLEQLTIIT